MASYSAVIAEQMSGRNPKIAALVELEFQSETVRLWSGVGPLVADGFEWLGSGQLISTSEIQQLVHGASSTMTFSISGVEPSLIDVAIDDYSNGELDDAKAKIQLQFFDQAWQPLDAPLTMWSGRMHDFSRAVSTESDGRQTAVLTVEAASVFALRSSPANSFLSDKDQQYRHPGDQFLELMPTLGDATIKFPDF